MRTTRVAALLVAAALPASAQKLLHVGPALGSVPNFAAVGDLDADGSPDYAVCTSPSLVELRSGADGSSLGTVSGADFSDAFGAALAGVGDVDLDGVPDLLIGAPLDDTAGTNAGWVRLFSGDDHSVLVSLQGTAAEQRLGSAVSSVGDANGDGTRDLLMATQAPFSGPVAGSVFLRSGLDGALLQSWTGAPGQGFGFSLAGPGDVDGDGLADVALTLPQGPSDVRLYSSATGLAIWGHTAHARDVRAAGDVDDDGTPDLIALADYFLDGTARVISGATGFPLLAFGDGGSWQFGPWGESADALGDVNGDGVIDFLLGEAFSEVAGRAHAYSGADGSKLYTVNEFTGQNIGPVFGEGTFGARAVPLGDLDDDGVPDFGVSEPQGVRTFSGFVNAFDVIYFGWTPLGSNQPDLFAASELSPGSKVDLVVKSVDASQPIFLVAGDSEAYLPFKGGEMVPMPLLVLGPFFANEPGALRVVGHWPNGAPAGIPLVLQAWIQDVSQPQGWAATNGAVGVSID